MGRPGCTYPQGYTRFDMQTDDRRTRSAARSAAANGQPFTRCADHQPPQEHAEPPQDADRTARAETAAEPPQDMQTMHRPSAAEKAAERHRDAHRAKAELRGMCRN